MPVPSEAVPPSDRHQHALVPFAPRAERRLEVFGAPVELVFAPERAMRPGREAGERPAMQRSRAARIVAEESLWRTADLVLTPNRHPFGRRHRLLWTAGPGREPDATLWRAALTWAAAHDGSVLLNNIGAAATIARAHAHLLDERLSFLSALPERALATDLIDLPDGCRLVHKQLPFCLIGVRGEPAGVATALVRLAECRLTASWNVIAEGATAWVVPRRLETPAPWFPQPLGAAELWGRWCYVEQEAFAATTGPDLEQALLGATAPALS